MIAATGLKKFAKYYPNRIFDAGIAEAHAVTFCCGSCSKQYKPVVAIYSTFLQRAYDQILIDVCMQNLPVIFAIDRAGNVGADGETHHGVFDLSYLSHMPNMTIMAPKDGRELEDMMEYALRLDGPSAIRYPRGEVIDNVSELENKIIDGTSERIIEGNDVEIFAVGKMVSICMEACIKLKELGVNAGLYNVRFVKPCDKKSILSAATRVKYIVTVEDNVLEGGFGSIVNRILAEEGMCDIKVLNIGWPDKFIEQGSTPELFENMVLIHSIYQKGCVTFLKERLDTLLVSRDYSSREKAKSAIMAGIIYVDGQRVDKAGTGVKETLRFC